MSTLPTVDIGGDDFTAWLQHRSMSIKRNSFDATFIDTDGALPAIPVVGDTVTVTDPAWVGVINLVESTGYRGNVPFYKVRAINADPLPDEGAAPFNLADTGTRYSSPAGFKDLVVTRVKDTAFTEVRSKCIVFKEGLSVGMEIDITSVVEGYAAETWTIMELTYDWPVDAGATYTLDLGLGEYTDAVEGPPGAGGTPDGPFLSPPDLEDEIARIARENCCEDDGPDSGIPLTTDAGACDTGTAHAFVSYDDFHGDAAETLGGAGTDDEVGSWVYYNEAYTSGTFPCLIGGGSWHGFHDEQIVLEYTAPADDPTYLGIQTSIDASALTVAGNVFGYEVRALKDDKSAVTWANSGTSIAGGNTGSVYTVRIPRSHVLWGADNCLILRPAWLCERPVQFCNDVAYFGNPHADGRANSGSYGDFAYDDFCPYLLTTGQSGQATEVPGIGDVDGVNAVFELVSWDGTGGVEASINGLEESGFTLDTGAHEVTFLAPPPADSLVLFTYHAVT